MSYKICCILSGDNTEFSVKLDESMTVHDLKEKIKVKYPVRLASMDPLRLTLYHINLKLGDEAGALPLHDRVKLKMKDLKEKGESPLCPSSKVRTHYPTKLEDDMLQIFAHLPESESAKTATNITLMDVVDAWI